MKRTARRYVFLASVGITLALSAEAAASMESAAPAPAAPPTDGPRLAASESKADLGTIFHGDTAYHTFMLRNTGSTPLAIESVKRACGCTVVEYDATIAPGKEGKVKTAVDTVTLGSGAGNTHVEVFSNDPASPLRLELSYNVIDRLFATPGFARWKSTRGEREGTIANTIWSTDGKEFHVLSVEPPTSELRATFRPATDAERQSKATGSQWRVELTLGSQAPVGAITGHVLVRTDHPEQKTLALPISGFVRPTVNIFPEVGDFGTISISGKAVRAYFKVTNYATEPIAITSVDVDVPGMTTEVVTVEPGREYKVLVSVAPDKQDGPFAGTLTVHTDSPKAAAVTAPVKGTVARETVTANAS